jgi:hypothetical protein
MLNEKVCKAYVNNTYERRHTVARWQELYEEMPIGVPLTATEIANRANENGKEHYTVYSHHNIPPMARAMGLGVIKREKIAIEPYEIEVEYFDHWDRGADGGYREVKAKKKIIVSEKTVYTRLV